MVLYVPSKLILSFRGGAGVKSLRQVNIVCLDAVPPTAHQPLSIHPRLETPCPSLHFGIITTSVTAFLDQHASRQKLSPLAGLSVDSCLTLPPPKEKLKWTQQHDVLKLFCCCLFCFCCCCCCTLFVCFFSLFLLLLVAVVAVVVVVVVLAAAVVVVVGRRMMMMMMMMMVMTTTMITMMTMMAIMVTMMLTRRM